MRIATCADRRVCRAHEQARLLCHALQDCRDAARGGRGRSDCQCGFSQALEPLAMAAFEGERALALALRLLAVRDIPHEALPASIRENLGRGLDVDELTGLSAQPPLVDRDGAGHAFGTRGCESLEISGGTNPEQSVENRASSSSRP